MRFSRIDLTNFRSFGPETTSIEFPRDQSLVTFIGSNNAGKSNLLDGVRLALGNIRRFEPRVDDFYDLDSGRELTIELHLREPLRREAVFRSIDEIHAFRFRAWRLTSGPNRGELRSENYCLDAEGKVYVPPAAVGKKREPGDETIERRQTRPEPASRVVRQLGPVHYLSPDLADAFRVTGSGVLARLLDLYRDDFRSESNVYKVHETGEELTSSVAFERISRRMEDILRTKTLSEIEAELSRHLTTFLGPDKTAQVSLALPPVEELLRSILRLRLQDDPGGPVVPVDRMGAGYRSLLRLAILQSYATLAGDEKPAVFLIEEPEAYLHPHLRRFCRRVLADLAAAGHDVIATTHDPALVSIADYPTILRLAKVGLETEAFRCTESLDLAYDRVATKLVGTRNEEMLFADRVVLCEGQDDVAVVAALLELLDIDLDARSISVVNAGGAGNLPDYIRLLSALEIESLVVADADSATAATDESVAERVQTVRTLTADKAFLFKENIEVALATEKKKRNNPAHLVELTEALDFASLPVDNEIAALRLRLAAFTGAADPRQAREAEADE